MEHHTVTIIGAGPSGIAAAVAATRAGVAVVLVERTSSLGGAGSLAAVGTVCGLSRCGGAARGEPVFDNPGFAREFGSALASRCGTTLQRSELGVSFLPYTPREFEEVSREFLRGGGARLEVNLGEALLELAYDPSGRTFTARTLSRSVTSGAVVDCSGDAVASRMLGCAVEEPLQPQAAALIFRLSGLPRLPEVVVGMVVRKALREGAIDRRLPERATYVSMVPGSLRGDSAWFKLGVAAPRGPGEVEAIAAQARTDIAVLARYLRDSGESFRDLTCEEVAPSLGIRSGRRGVGRSRLDEETVRMSRRSADGVALGLWPMEVWSTPERPLLTFPERGDGYEIPLGALCSRDLPGLYFAGRGVSASDEAIASARVMGTSLSTGFAAGRAAAGFVRGEPIESVITELRTRQVESFYSS